MIYCNAYIAHFCGGTHIKSSDVIRFLGVLLTPKLSMNKHVTSLSAKYFFQLRQLRRIRHLLDDDSVATLVHAFVANLIDCCVGLLADSSKKTTAKLQRVLNAAARVVSNCGKYDRGLTHFRRHVLHSLDVMTELGSGCAFRCTSVDTAWLLDT